MWSWRSTLQICHYNKIGQLETTCGLALAQMYSPRYFLYSTTIFFPQMTKLSNYLFLYITKGCLHIRAHSTTQVVIEDVDSASAVLSYTWFLVNWAKQKWWGWIINLRQNKERKNKAERKKLPSLLCLWRPQSSHQECKQIPSSGTSLGYQVCFCLSQILLTTSNIFTFYTHLRHHLSSQFSSSSTIFWS